MMQSDYSDFVWAQGEVCARKHVSERHIICWRYRLLHSKAAAGTRLDPCSQIHAVIDQDLRRTWQPGRDDGGGPDQLRYSLVATVLGKPVEARYEPAACTTA